MNIWTSLALTPHTLSYEQIDGVQTRILAADPPDASPLVFLHGVSGHLEAFAHNLPAFAERYRVIAYDYPGHGYSDCPRERSYEIAGYVDHLTALLDAYDIERATLIGLSLGGWISARMAQCNPALRI